MKQTQLTLERLLQQSSVLMGKTVEKMLNAYGYVLYLEIGTPQNVELLTPGGKKYSSEQGEWTLAIEGDWKFWEKGQIVADSRTEDRDTIDPKIDNFSSQKMIIQSFTLGEKGEQALLTFQNGLQLKINKDPNDKEGQLWSQKKRGANEWLVVEDGTV